MSIIVQKAGKKKKLHSNLKAILFLSNAVSKFFICFSSDSFLLYFTKYQHERDWSNTTAEVNPQRLFQTFTNLQLLILMKVRKKK